MNLLTAFWAVFTSAVQPPGNLSQVDASDLLQIEAPTLTDQQCDDWFVAIATMYASFDIIVQPTYVQLRTLIIGAEQQANDLFVALQQGIGDLPESIIVVAALKLQFETLALAEVPTSIVLLEAARDAQSDADLTTAYNQAIAALLQREVELNSLLGT